MQSCTIEQILYYSGLLFQIWVFCSKHNNVVINSQSKAFNDVTFNYCSRFCYHLFQWLSEYTTFCMVIHIYARLNKYRLMHEVRNTENTQLVGLNIQKNVEQPFNTVQMQNSVRSKLFFHQFNATAQFHQIWRGYRHLFKSR